MERNKRIDVFVTTCHKVNPLVSCSSGHFRILDCESLDRNQEPVIVVAATQLYSHVLMKVKAVSFLPKDEDFMIKTLLQNHKPRVVLVLENNPKYPAHLWNAAYPEAVVVPMFNELQVDEKVAVQACIAFLEHLQEKRLFSEDEIVAEARNLI